MEIVHSYINFVLITAIALLLIFYRKIYRWPNFPFNNIQFNRSDYYKCIQSWSEGKKNFAVIDKYANPQTSLGKKFSIVKTKELLIPEHIYEIMNNVDTYYRNFTKNEELQLL